MHDTKTKKTILRKRVDQLSSLFGLQHFYQWALQNEMRMKTIRGGIALGMGTGFEGLMRFLWTVLIAKLLLPNEVGLIAILLATTQIFESMTEVGINLSVIQNKKSHENAFLNAAWWFQTIRGFGLYLVGFFAAPFIAAFFNELEMVWMLRVTFLMVPLKSFMSPRAYILEKDLEYFKYMILYQGSILASTVLLISLFILWKSVWAWVIAFTFQFALFSLLSYCMCPFLPSLNFEKESFAEIFKFARGMLGLPILVLIAFQLDIFVLGRMVPREMIGLYAMAVVLARIPRELFMKIFGRLMLPVFSRYQDSVNLLRQIFLKVTHVTALLSFPLTGFLIGCSGPLLAVAFKPEYVTVSGVFCILCLVMLFRVQALVLASVYMAMGQPHLQRLFVAIRAGTLILIIFPCIYYGGLLGAACAVLIAEISGFTAQLFQMQRLLKLRFSDFADCYRSGFWVMVVLVALLCLEILILPESLTLYFIIGILSLIPIYITILLRSAKSFKNQIYA